MQQVLLQGEVLADRTKTRQESLRAFAVAKLTHAQFAGGLVAVLGPVIDPGKRL